MKEESIDYQHHLPPFKNFIKTEEHLATVEIQNSRYTFPSRAELAASRVRRRMLELVTSNDASPYSFPQQQFVDIRWRKIIDYLRGKGVISDILLDPTFNDEIKLYFFDIFSPLDRSTTDGHSPQYAGYSRGVSDNYDEAISKVIGEYLERYPLLLYRKEWLTRASIAQLKKSGKKFLDPRWLPEFSEQQKKESAELFFDEDSLFSWIKGKSLLDESDALIPAQLVFWAYCRHHDDGVEPLLREANTNGAGGNFTRAGALLSGLYECIQRDAFFVYWFNKKSPRKIDNATITEPSIKQLLQEAEKLRFEIHFLDTTSDIKIPAAVAVIVDNSGVGPKVSLGGGCGADPAQVLHRALTEACGLYHWIRKKPASTRINLENYKPFSDPAIGQLERLRFWGNADVFPKLAFLFSGDKESYQDFMNQNKRYFKSEVEELKWAVAEVSKGGAGYEPFYYMPAHPLLQELGYFSAKVIVPKLLPLYLSEHHAPAKAGRIGQAMNNMGLQPAESINPWPHPFP